MGNIGTSGPAVTEFFLLVSSCFVATPKLGSLAIADVTCGNAFAFLLTAR